MNVKEKAAGYLRVAIQEKASDLFFSPAADGWLVKLRVISHCQVIDQLDEVDAASLINYFKFTAQMDISEHRRPQVGSFSYLLAEKEYYLRLSSVGNFDGRESLVIRIIYGLSESRYFYSKQLEDLQHLCLKRGLIITSGPTGSGKTTTMYELARKISANKVVMTIEDPVEVYIDTFLQTQVNLEADISYVDLLKAALRQRPDILIIGEIRDMETAKLAVAAALSGHLVLATVHAKSTLQTVSRLLGLGISKTELMNCLTAVSYQRLIPEADGMLSCLVDIAPQQLLQEKIFDKQIGDFVKWQDNLAKLKKNGRISNETYVDYIQG